MSKQNRYDKIVTDSGAYPDKSTRVNKSKSTQRRRTSNLSKICEEAFGRENFVCRFGWETKKAAQGMTTVNMVVDNQESIYVYAKQIGMFKFRGLDRDETNGFSNPDKDPRGLWKRQYLQRLGQGLPVRTITKRSAEKAL